MLRFLRDIGLIFSAILLFSTIVSAAEEITITTYYPSPYGSYNQLQSKTLGVGDNNGNGVLDSGDVPDPIAHPGDVWIKGKVGIGTSTPGAKLDVNGNIYDSGGSLIFSTATGTHTGIGNTAGWAAIENAANYNTLMILGRSGGIGGVRSVSIWDRLDVNGQAYCSSGVWSGSDIRWKKNIESLPNDTLGRVLKLRGVKFQWRREDFKDKSFRKGKQIGIIAQEIEKQFPELISTDADGYKSFAYDKFTVVLLEAIKAQQEEIKGLKEELAGIKTMLKK
ncbi:MAG: tail fiber domain-containing protein [Candidatus Omnitrophica bacterium]|nr:tail fiber domain-containing protein [Candidatus Omnitrophota bacterium]